MLDCTLRRASGSVAINASFIKHWPQLVEFEMTMQYKHGEGPLKSLIGGTNSKTNKNDTTNLLENKNTLILDPETLRQYLPVPVTENKFSTESVQMMQSVGVLLQKQITFFESPNSIVYVVTVGMDDTMIFPELMYNYYTHTIKGLDKELSFADVATEKQQIELIDQINKQQFKFINSASIASVQFMGSVAYHQPISLTFKSTKQKTADIQLEIEELSQKINICRDCILNKQHQCQSSCEKCCATKTICDDCKKKGHKHWFPALRACDACLLKGIRCIRLGTSFIVMDSDSAQLSAQKKISEIINEILKLIPLGEGPHNAKALLNSMRNFLLLIIIHNRNQKQEFHQWLTSLGLIQELAQSNNKILSLQIRKIIPADILALKDKQDPKNVLYFTKPELVNLIPDGLLCGSILPISCWNDKTKYFTNIKFVTACKGSLAVVDEKGYHLITLKLKSKIQTIQETELIRSICFLSKTKLVVSMESEGKLFMLDLQAKPIKKFPIIAKGSQQIINVNQIIQESETSLLIITNK